MEMTEGAVSLSRNEHFFQKDTIIDAWQGPKYTS